MSNKLSLCAVLLLLTAASCKKSSTEEEKFPGEKTIAATELNAVAALATPSVKNSMINYESYYVSAVDGLKHGYIISLPLNYNPDDAVSYPLMVFLHGAGEKPSTDYDIAKLKVNGPHKEIYSKKRAFPAIIVSIQMEKWAAELKPEVTKEFIDVLTKAKTVSQASGAGLGLTGYKIDLGKIHLTGLSQGGASVYKTAFTYPDLFASISVFSGYTGSQAQMSLIHIPAYIRHNSGDATVGVTNANNAQRWIDGAKPSEPVNLLIYNASGHDAWSLPYASEELYNWHWSKSRKVTTPVYTNPIESPSAPETAEPEITIPSASPAISTLYPANNSVISKPSSGYISLEITFDKEIKRGAGLIRIKNETDNTSYDTYATWGMVGISGKKSTIYPVPVSAGKKYTVTIVSGAFLDQSGLAFAGITNSTTWTFTIN